MKDNRQNQKDIQRKGDTKSLSKAVGATANDQEGSISPRVSDDGIVNLVPSTLKKRYESGPSATSDTEPANASQKMYKTTPIMVEQPTQTGNDVAVQSPIPTENDANNSTKGEESKILKPIERSLVD